MPAVRTAVVKGLAAADQHDQAFGAGDGGVEQVALQRITAPLLVVHGTFDTYVPIVEAEQIVAALRERGASPGFLLFDDEGHEVHSTANRAVFVREVVRWVTQHLLET